MILLPSIEGSFSAGGGLAGAVTVVSVLAGKQDMNFMSRRI